MPPLLFSRTKWYQLHRNFIVVGGGGGGSDGSVTKN